MNAPSALVTGASGLIGSHTARVLEADGWTVHTAGRGGATHPLDFAGDWDASRLPSKVDAVVHLAQAENYRDFPGAAETMYRVNTDSTVRLLAWARAAGAKHFVLASTGSLYGTGPKPFTEDDPVSTEGPLGFYLATKRAAEIFAEAYRSQYAVSILRFFFVYGPGQKAAMIMPRLIRSVREGTPIKLQGQDGLRLNPIHAQDAARAVAALLRSDQGALLNVAGCEISSLREVGEAIGRALGIVPKFEHDLSASPGHVMADVSRLVARCGAPSIRFADGVKRWLEVAPQ